MESIVPKGSDNQDDGRHDLPAEWLTVFDKAWFYCSCGERFDIPVTDDGSAVIGAAVKAHESHASAAARPGGVA